MNPLLWIFQFVFGCHHRHLSRVFTIKQRTYKVCFDCGEEFELPNADASRFGAAGSPRVRLDKVKPIRSFGDLIVPPHKAPNAPSPDVSYLAQTRESAPVILYSPECVERAATANS